MEERKFEIIEHLGVLSSNGIYKKELNYIKWLNNDPKFDIREWNSDHSKMKKGVTLTITELLRLLKIIGQTDLINRIDEFRNKKNSLE